MKIDLYAAVKALIKGNTAISEVILYRQPDSDVMLKNPFVMLEFNDIRYENMSNKRQEAEASFVVHLICDTINSEDEVASLEHTQDIYVILARAGYIRTAESVKPFDVNVIDYQITFEAPRYEDDDAVTRYISYPKPPIDIEVEV